MAVTFRAKDHKYQSQDPNEDINWIGVTSLVSTFKEKFDPISQSIKSSKNRRSKWYGMDPEAIREIWTSNSDMAMSNGSKYHDQRESDLMSIDYIARSGVMIPIIKPIIEGDLKIAPNQKLTEGIYPEHFVYLKSAGICGQSDRVEVIKDTVHVIDYKTNKEIKKEAFRDWQGISKKMLSPLDHLEDCNFNHYALQLSTYMYMILKHNPQYKAGKLTLHHIIFEKEGEDKFGNPILKKDFDGEFIVEKVVPYDVPYLKTEVVMMINHLKETKTNG